MTGAPQSGREKRSPLSWGILTVAMAIGAYILVTAFENYDSDSPVCGVAAAVAGSENVPKQCKFPVLEVVLGAVIIGAGMTVANKVG
jgi:hypothetical protein